MKAGYYISESNNLQLWYPKGYFKKGYQTMELLLSDGYVKVHYDKKTLGIVMSIFNFEFIGEL
jgi:hypothetical protein